MLPVNCPSCGASYRIPPDRLAAQMHCRKCDTRFYFDDGGSLKTGKKPSPKHVEDDSARYKNMSKLPDLDAKAAWRKLPLAVRLALAAGILVGLGAIFAPWVNRARLQIPEDLNNRAEFAARAILVHDDVRFKAICLPEASAEAAELAEGVRGVLEKKGLGADATIMVQQQAHNKDRRTTLSARFLPASLDGVVPDAGPRASRDRGPSKAAVQAVSARTLELNLVWVKGDDGRWLLDPVQTLRSYGADSNDQRALSHADNRR